MPSSASGGQRVVPDSSSLQFVPEIGPVAGRLILEHRAAAGVRSIRSGWRRRRPVRAGAPAAAVPGAVQAARTRRDRAACGLAPPGRAMRVERPNDPARPNRHQVAKLGIAFLGKGARREQHARPSRTPSNRFSFSAAKNGRSSGSRQIGLAQRPAAIDEQEFFRGRFGGRRRWLKRTDDSLMIQAPQLPATGTVRRSRKWRPDAAYARPGRRRPPRAIALTASITRINPVRADRRAAGGAAGGIDGNARAPRWKCPSPIAHAALPPGDEATWCFDAQQLDDAEGRVDLGEVYHQRRDCRCPRRDRRAAPPRPAPRHRNSSHRRPGSCARRNCRHWRNCRNQSPPRARVRHERPVARPDTAAPRCVRGEASSSI